MFVLACYRKKILAEKARAIVSPWQDDALVSGDAHAGTSRRRAQMAR